eukprot:403340973
MGGNQSHNTNNKVLEQSDAEHIPTECEIVLEAIFDSKVGEKILLQIYVNSGKGINDLGNYQACERVPQLHYALVTIKSKSDPMKFTQLGLCIPKECRNGDLNHLNRMYIKSMEAYRQIQDPDTPEFTFPYEEFQTLNQSSGSFPVVAAGLIFGFLICMSIFGAIVEKSSIGDKKGVHSSMVEAVEEDNPNQPTIEYRKERWALFFYSFSITRNFQEIFFRPSKAIKDKKFQVFNGIRVQMINWIILGHCYLIGSLFGISRYTQKQKVLDYFLAQIIMSSDMVISFFYFMSAFICMFTLIKKYQRDAELSIMEYENARATEIDPSSQASSSHSMISKAQPDDQQQSIPRLNKNSLMKQILARWLRLAFPTYLIVLFSVTLFPYIGAGPTFTYVYNLQLQNQLKQKWWTLLLFIQNWVPWNDESGMYWLFFIANDLQFYAFILCPSIFLYQKRNKRGLVVILLSCLILLSMLYLLIVSIDKGFSSMLVIENTYMFSDIYKRPFGPVGFYALGIIASIFYFEYSQAISNRQLRKRRAYQFMTYIGKSKQRSLKTQFYGGLLLIFVIFIRYSSFGYNTNEQSLQFGRWPLALNAIFNAFAHYLFIIGWVLILLPIFIGKLSIVRDIYAAEIFTPLSRISFSVSQMQGLILFLFVFCQEQLIQFDNKNMFFLYFSVIICVYVSGFFVALFLEYPFRTMAKIMFSPSTRILRLNKELAQELNVEDIQYTEATEDDYGSQVSSQRSSRALYSGGQNISVEPLYGATVIQQKLTGGSLDHGEILDQVDEALDESAEEEFFKNAELKVRQIKHKNKRLTKINELEDEPFASPMSTVVKKKYE